MGGWENSPLSIVAPPNFHQLSLCRLPKEGEGCAHVTTSGSGPNPVADAAVLAGLASSTLQSKRQRERERESVLKRIS